MNLPNRLTIARIILVPFLMVFLLIPVPFPFDGELICRVLAAAIFLAGAITDHLDGKIARKRHLVTDFGKFLDPLADKMMVLGAMIGLIVLNSRAAGTENEIYMRLTAGLCFLVLFRELAVTSLRLAVADKGVVISASVWGKIKTVTQIVYVMIALLEPVVMGKWLLGRLPFFAAFSEHHLLSYTAMLVVLVSTTVSGALYFKSYFPLLKGKM